MSNTLQGYDMVVAITENAINHELAELLYEGIIQPTFQATLASGDPPASIDVTAMAPPTVSVSTPSGSAPVLLFNLAFTTGTLSYTDAGNPIDVPVDGWTIALQVNIGAVPLTTTNGIAAPAGTVAALNARLSDSNFAITQLFLDFENANYDQLAVTAQGVGLDPNSVEFAAVKLLFQQYLTGLAGSANPYVLGYQVTTSNPAATAPSLPAFAPTAGTFALAPNGGAAGLGTLDYCLMTLGAQLPASSPSFTQAWVSDPTVQGTMVIDGMLFLESYIEALILPAVQKAFASSTGFIRTCVPLDLYLGQWSLTTATSNLDQNDGYGPIWGSNAGLMNIYNPETNTTQLTLNLQTGSGGVQLTGSGSFQSYAALTEYPLGILRTLASVTVVQNFNVTISLLAGSDGTLNVTASVVASGGPQVTPYEKWIVKLYSDWIDPTITQTQSDTTAQLTAAQQAQFSSLQSQLQAGIGALSSQVILPAGSVFFYRGITINDQMDFQLDVTFQDG